MCTHLGGNGWKSSTKQSWFNDLDDFFPVHGFNWVELLSGFETCFVVVKRNVQVAMSLKVTMFCKISLTKQMGFPYKTFNSK